jgi:hypothetical protein
MYNYIIQHFIGAMKKCACLLLPCVLLFTVKAFGQDYYDLIQQAGFYHDSKDYVKSVNLYEQAFKLGKKDPDKLFKAACLAAITGDNNKAFAFLSLAFNAGYASADRFQKEVELNTLHQDKRWAALNSKIQARSYRLEKGYDIPLQTELLAIFSDDTIPRNELGRLEAKPGDNSRAIDSISTLMQHNDSINGFKVSKILDKYGWPGKDKVNANARLALFLAMDHSLDLHFQLKYLPIMRDAVAKGNARADCLATLEDRVAVRQAKRQSYGTQLSWDDKANKNYVSPLDDPEHVDHRRALMGLAPMVEYLKDFDLTWDAKVYAKQLPELDKLSKKW